MGTAVRIRVGAAPRFGAGRALGSPRLTDCLELAISYALRFRNSKIHRAAVARFAVSTNHNLRAK
jgi:hypothetical protein